MFNIFKRNKAFFIDKFFDASFVFVGIFCAFFFNQCQKKAVDKKELYFRACLGSNTGPYVIFKVSPYH